MKVLLLCSLHDCDQPVDRDPVDGVRTMDAMEAEVRYCSTHDSVIKQNRKKFDTALEAVKLAHKKLGEVIGNAVWQDDFSEGNIRMMFRSEVLEGARKINATEIPL